MSNKFNKYCIDCQNNKTTHALIWHGIFVCKECAEKHLIELPKSSMSTCYVKDVFGELWDDYQLKSVQLGGNERFFEILKEFGI